MEGLLLGAGQNAVEEIPVEWYENILTQKGILMKGKFLKDHSQYYSHSPVATRGKTTRKPNQSLPCEECGKKFKTQKTLSNHKTKVHGWIES